MIEHEYIATREEGAAEAQTRVILPAGEYEVVVYDDEDADIHRAAYITTLTVPYSSLMHNSGMCSVWCKCCYYILFYMFEVGCS